MANTAKARASVNRKKHPWQSGRKRARVAHGAIPYAMIPSMPPSQSQVTKVTLMADGFYRQNAVLSEALIKAVQDTIVSSGVRFSMNLFVECKP